MIRQPLPCAASGGVYRGIDVDTPQAGFLGYILASMIGAAKLANLIFGEQNLSVLFAPIRCAVLDAIHRIFRAAGPINVLPIYAFSIAATMCRIPTLWRAFSVDFFADQPMHPMFDTVDANASVTAFIDRKRPLDASVSERQDRGFDKPCGVEIFPIGHLAKHTHCSPTVNGGAACRF